MGDTNNTTTTDHHHYETENKAYVFSTYASNNDIETGADAKGRIIVDLSKITKVNVTKISYQSGGNEKNAYTVNISLDNDYMTVVAYTDTTDSVEPTLIFPKLVAPNFPTYSVVKSDDLQKFLTDYAEYTNSTAITLADL